MNTLRTYFFYYLACLLTVTTASSYVSNFLLLLVQNLAVSIDDARRLIAAWHRAYPRVQELFSPWQLYLLYFRYEYG